MVRRTEYFDNMRETLFTSTGLPFKAINLKMGNEDKNQGVSAVTIEGASGNLTGPWVACHTNTDLSQEREAKEATRDAALTKLQGR